MERQSSFVSALFSELAGCGHASGIAEGSVELFLGKDNKKKATLAQPYFDIILIRVLLVSKTLTTEEKQMIMTE